MLMPLRPFLRAGPFLAAFTLWTHSAAAQTAHCFNDRSGPEVPCTARSSGGNVAPAPVYRGPSSAELARRHRQAAAYSANKAGLNEFNRNNLNAAVRHFERARSLWPHDRNIQANYWRAKAELAETELDYASAVTDFQNLLRYNNLPEFKFDLEWAQRNAAAERHDWATALRGLPRSAPIIDFIHAREALDRKDWTTAIRKLKKYEKYLSHSMSDMSAVTQNLVRMGHLSRKMDSSRWFLYGTAKRNYDKDGRNLARTKKFIAFAKSQKEQQSNQNYLNPPIYDDAVSHNQASGHSPQSGSSPSSRQDNAGASTGTPRSFPEGGALGQAKAANQTGKSATAQSGHEPLTVPGGPNERASDLAGKEFDQGISVPAHGAVAKSSDANKPTAFSIPGWSPDKMTKLASTPSGREVIEAEKKWRGALDQSNKNISAIKAKLGTATPDEKMKLMSQWTAELNAQPEIDKKLNELDQQAGQIVTQVHLDR
jgi:hypothetical protein